MNQMSGNNIDYVILNKDTIQPNTGKIDSIVQKDSDGFLIQVSGSLSFEIKLKHKAIVSLVEVQPEVGEQITIELMGDKNKVTQTVIKQIQKYNKTILVEFPDSLERQAVTSKLKIQIANHNKEDYTTVGLRYLLVKGEKSQEKPNKISMKTEVPRRDYYDEAKHSPHHFPADIKKKDNFFSDRKKAKEGEDFLKIQPSNKMEDYDLDQPIKINKIPKRQMREEIANYKDLQKAIELSKKQAREKQELPNPQSKKIAIVSKPREYTKLDFQKFKRFYENVNHAWIDAQRRIQIAKGVKESERLSNAIEELQRKK